MLFGTAMDEDVEDLWERYNHLASLAANQNKAINMNSLHINRLEHVIQDIASFSRTVRTALNAVIKNMKGIHEMAMINQTLHALESTINSVLHTNNLVIQNVVDTDHDRVTSSLFPVKDFQRVLMKGEKEHQLAPLIAAHAIHHYYPLLESFLTSDAIVIHVPFKSKDDSYVFTYNLFHSWSMAQL